MPQRLVRLTKRFRAIRASADSGMTTAEYAIGTIAAAAFAALLLAIIKSDVVRSALTALVKHALSVDY